MKVTVKVYEQGREVFARVFDEGVYRAGRSEFSDIPLASDSVSRSHMELRVSDGAVYVTNMSAPGRVKLNGRPVETGEIADGDEITVGPYHIIIFHGEKESEAPAPEPMAMAAGAEGDAGMQFGDAGAGGGGGENAEGGEGGGGGFGASPDGGGGGGFGESPDGGQAPGFEADGGGGAAVAQMELDRAPEGSSLNRSETQVEAKPLVAKLVFTEGPRAGEEIPIESYEVTFGRSKRADIFLDDEKLSRIHCKIARVGMGYRLIDMESRHGTYVNGMRILEHPLTSFDQLEIGTSKIKFLIYDSIGNADVGRNKLATVESTQSMQGGSEQTKSVQIDALPPDVLVELQNNRGFGAPPGVGEMYVSDQPDPDFQQKKSPLVKIALGALIALALIYLVMPSGDKPKPKEGDPQVAGQVDGASKLPPINLPSGMPKEYAELSPELQRMVEGHYNSALKAAELQQYEEAVGHLRKIHDYLPFYKQSKEKLEEYAKKVKEKQIAEAQEKAKRDEKQDLQIYLEEGQEYLKEGDFDRAAESFNSAIVIDPTNQLAIKGLKAAELKLRSVDDIPPERDPEADKRKLVAELFQKAVAAFTNKAYQEAIDTAERIRGIELKGDTQYLNEAKQIIDRAKMLQKEEFEPFLIQAKEKYAEGDYNASRDLCEEMLKRDNSYEEAKECVLKAKKQLNRLAKEAYTYGYILESMNRLEEAKQYWNRAKNYVRGGDDYFDKVNRKLDQYQ